MYTYRGVSEVKPGVKRGGQLESLFHVVSLVGEQDQNHHWNTLTGPARDSDNVCFVETTYFNHAW